jgi:sugar phosphate isomerase/epimerase
MMGDMKMGICTPVANSGIVKAAGWDFVEENVQGFLCAHTKAADQWQGADQASGAALPVPAANSMVPGDHKIVGPNVDSAKLAKYMAIVLSRAQRVGMKTIVFGSGVARMVPEGFDKKVATDQIVTFLKSIAQPAADRGVTIVVEHLNKTETNILNSLLECAEVVRRVNHPAVSQLFDTWHYWMDKLDVSELKEVAKGIRHVHLAESAARVAPGLSGEKQWDYVPLFSILKGAGYDGMISVEALNFDVGKDAKRVGETVRAAWARA